MKIKRNNSFNFLIATLSTFIYFHIPIQSEERNLYKINGQNTNNSEVLNPISIGNISSDKEVINLKIANNKKFFKLIISNVGINAKVFSVVNKDGINFEISSIENKYIKNNEQNLSIPSIGIINAKLYGKNKRYKLNLKLNEKADKDNFEMKQIGSDIEIVIKKSITMRNDFNEDNIFSINQSEGKSLPSRNEGAVAPPLGDIAIGTTLIPNPNLLNLSGPNVSLVFKQTQAKKALEFLLSKANYGFVWVQQDPSFNPDGNSGGGSIQNISNEGNPNSSSRMESSLIGTSSETSDSSEKNADSHRYITLSLKNVPFNNAFNAVLMASGMQAKLVNNIVYVGPNVRDSVFNNRISRVYRLNQTTANAAASYLANLGAKVTKTSTISTAVTQGATQSETVAGGGSSSTTRSGTTTSVEIYGSDIGPLLGLIATTDDRLETVTMIGTSSLITVAEEYLKKLDLRQRQVALTVRILDVQLDDGSTFNNSWAMKQNDNFIINDNGKLISAFGKVLPPTNEDNFTPNNDNNIETFTTDTSSTPANSRALTQIRKLNPVNIYSNQTFIKFLRAEIISKNTKILANPTLILNEFPGKSGGETVAFSEISQALASGSIGRAYGNEGFVIVGNQVPINCTSSDGDTASFEYGISGLTFGARILRIDDNGYVTFAISPSVSAVSSVREIQGCGVIDLLSVRRLDSGSIRVKNGNTLILTGVLNATDKETINKFPFFGDLPIIGHFFRNRVSSKDQRELVILVTPRILDGSDQQYQNINNKINPND